VLATWAEIRSLYRQCQPGVFKASFTHGGLRMVWPSWALTIAVGILLVGTWFNSQSPLQGLAAMAGALLALFGMLLARERYCAWYYRDIYARETLNRYGFLRREELLRYALFRNALLKRGLDAADIQELARIAEIAGPPPQERWVSQNLVIVMLVSAIVSLSTDVIKLTDTWIAGKGSVFVLALAMLTYVVLALLDGIRSNQHRDRVIGRCLERAALDVARGTGSNSSRQNATSEITAIRKTI
jgi:membrane protein YdbS with pleckstrin-like domain